MAGGFGPGGAPGGGMGRRLGGGEDFNGKLYDRKLIARLMGLAIPYWHLFALALLLIVVVSASALARPYLIKIGIDRYMHGAVSGQMGAAEAVEGLYRLGIFFLVLIITEFAFGYLQTYLLQYTGKRIILGLRSRIFRHIQKLPLSYFDKNSAGRIVTRVTNDPDALNEMFANVVVGFLKNVIQMVGIVIIMVNLSPQLTGVSFMVIPLMVLATVLFRKTARRVFREIRIKLAIINGFMAEHISGMKVIQAFNMQRKKYHQFEKINKEYYKANMNMVTIFGIFRPFMDVVRSLALALLLWYGGRNIIEGALEFGTLFIFVDYTNRFFQPIMELTEQYNTMQSSLVSAERIFGLLDQQPEPEPREGAAKLDEVKGRIEFRNVWFAYNGSDWVLKDISFTIEPGESVAFVGATGAGKTSIINLICGFYEHQRGQILIDGIDIKRIRKDHLRRHIGLVLQDVFLFSGDIETNIRLFNEEIPTEKVKQVAEYVNADYFIKELPDGYRHVVNEGGTTLSAGQRQLISFARALICDPKILVMDEATSNIDTETEGLIQEALTRLIKGRTTIAIAHRLSTIQKADKIIVIHKGRIREVGSHQELLAQKGLYYNLYMLQYKDNANGITA